MGVNPKSRGDLILPPKMDGLQGGPPTSYKWSYNPYK